MPGFGNILTEIENNILLMNICTLFSHSNLKKENKSIEFKKLRFGKVLDVNPLNLVYGDTIVTLEKVKAHKTYKTIPSMTKGTFLFTIKDDFYQYIVLSKDNTILCLTENQLTKTTFDKKGLQIINKIIENAIE